MRTIGALPSHETAERFRDYLTTRGIESQIEQDGPGDDPEATFWDVWILDEDRLDDAKVELLTFRNDPEAERYIEAARTAKAIREDTLRKQLAAKKNQTKVRDQWNAPIWKRLPITCFFMAACIACTVIGCFGLAKSTRVIYEQLRFSQVEYIGNGKIRWHAEGLRDIRNGEVWRIISPIFLHGDPLHLVFNMGALLFFGRRLEPKLGSGRLLAMMLFIAAISNFAQYWEKHNPLFLGISGVTFGMFGYCWVRGKLDPASGLTLTGQTIAITIAWFFLCMTGLVGPIANTAHGVGLLSGMLLAYLRMVITPPRHLSR